MSFLDDIFDWLGDLFTWLWEHFTIVLAICAILFIAFAPLLVGALGVGGTLAASLPTWLASWLPGLISAAATSWWVAIPAGLGLAYVINSDVVTSLVEGVAAVAVDTLTTVATGVGEAAGEVVTGVADGLTSSSLFLYTALGFGAYLLLSSDGDGESTDK